MNHRFLTIMLISLMAGMGCSSKDNSGKSDSEKTDKDKSVQAKEGCSNGVCVFGKLQWQKTPGGEGLIMKQEDAVKYCDSLDLDGGGWRLPTIDELRSLIRGCPATEAGGSCNVKTGGCLSQDCRDESCKGCSPLKGPYWPKDLEGKAPYVYWSSSKRKDDANRGWRIEFDEGNIVSDDLTGGPLARCVRSK